MATAPTAPTDPTIRRKTDDELESILVSFDTNYAWNYGSVKEGLRDLYEKAKRDQWNGTTQLVGAVPWMDAKYYASTQTMDEARHVEVFDRYLHEKLEWEWPINPNLKELLDATIKDSRWDFKYLGMQIIIEGLAMAAFGNLYQAAQEPLIKDLLKYVMKDESRHVAFGVLSLRDYYQDMPANELTDREDFIIYACELMRNRLVGEELANVMGWNKDEVRETVLESEIGKAFRAMLFMRVVPNLKKLGLITPRVREAFEKLEIIHFEDADPEAQDKVLGFLD